MVKNNNSWDCNVEFCDITQNFNSHATLIHCNRCKNSAFDNIPCCTTLKYEELQMINKNSDDISTLMKRGTLKFWPL